MAKRSVTLSPAEERSRRVLGIAMRLLDRDDADLATVLGLSRQAAQQRRTGGARLRQQDVEDIAAAWDLPIDLFRMEPEPAVGWLLENRRLVIAGVALTRSDPGEDELGDTSPRHGRHRIAVNHPVAA